MPLTFEAMLHYLYEQTFRKNISKSINFNQRVLLTKLENDEDITENNRKSQSSSCQKDLDLMTELLGAHDLRNSGEYHKSDSNSFYKSISQRVAKIDLKMDPY